MGVALEIGFVAASGVHVGERAPNTSKLPGTGPGERSIGEAGAGAYPLTTSVSSTGRRLNTRSVVPGSPSSGAASKT